MATSTVVKSATLIQDPSYFDRRKSDFLQVTHHRLISQDFDALRYDAAASLQLVPILTPGSPVPLDNKAITSPYNDALHLLNLDTIGLQERVLALAMTTMKPIRDDFRTADYAESFNWDAIFATVRLLCAFANHSWAEQEFYVVIFRSVLKENCDLDLLYELDKESHREAVESGGLLKYWFGKADQHQRNLATCKSSTPMHAQWLWS
jgi:hypothetical protein